MRVLVCGGRDYSDTETLFSTLDKLHKKNPISCIISGAASGADAIAISWAKDVGIGYEAYPAQWNKHGKSAGPIRNQQMIDEGKPDYCVAFPGGRGTADMVTRCRVQNILVIIVPPRPKPPRQDLGWD